MRTFFSIYLVAMALVALPTQGRSEETSGSHLTVAVFGDSLGDGVWSGLYAILRSHSNVTLLRRSKVGAGLTRPDYTSWLDDFKAALDAEPIDVAVVMFGANDQQGIRTVEHKGYVFSSAIWKAAYGDRIADVVTALEAHHVLTIWLGLPIMRKDELNTGARTLDALFADAAQTHGATFLPLAKDYVDETGAFTPSIVDPQ